MCGRPTGDLADDQPATQVIGPETGSYSSPGDPAAGLRTYYIKDNGLGIPEAQQAKIFLAFQRLHPEAAPGPHDAAGEFDAFCALMARAQ